MRVAIAVAATTLLLAACKTPPVEPVASAPLVPQESEVVAVDHVLVVFDSSGSISRRTLFPWQKALVEAFVKSMPDGDYEAGQIAFGGYERQVVPLDRFDRARLEQGVADLAFLDEATQLDRVLLEAKEALADRSGRAAIVIFSDGKPTAPGGWRPIPEETVRAARALAEVRDGTTCFFTVQTSDDSEGDDLLRRVAGVTDCGQYRKGSELQDLAALHDLERNIFLGEKLPDVAAAPACDVPGGRQADGSCWSPTSAHFAFGSAKIADGYGPELDEVADLLRANPDLRVRVDGHADSTGPDEFNVLLSWRRARAAKAYLESRGIASDRIDAVGWGAGSAKHPNDSSKNRARNRRIEFSFPEADL